MSISISFLIDGLNNDYLFFKTWVHELMSRNGGELMS